MVRGKEEEVEGEGEEEGLRLGTVLREREGEASF